MDKTDHMEDIKIRFQHDYNEAIDNYNSGDCVLFFRNIRPAIETLCKLVIFDLVDTVLAGNYCLDRKHCIVTIKIVQLLLLHLQIER